MDHVSVCPYCRGTHPHVGPTGCPPVTWPPPEGRRVYFPPGRDARDELISDPYARAAAERGVELPDPPDNFGAPGHDTREDEGRERHPDEEALDAGWYASGGDDSEYA